MSNEFKLDHESELIKRTRNTRSQINLPRLSRYSNVKNAFCINKSCDIKEKNILLIDDVLTTKATLEEVASVLKENGEKDIYELTLARS